ncbi:MAG: hypothetical protein RMJ75_01025 [Nitrososphaerota archaeon]|nr:hypothetical protein [Nitrososphaerota archaeon]
MKGTQKKQVGTGQARKSGKDEVDKKAAAVAVAQALAQPRLALYSPLASAVLNYLKNTTPRFSISSELAKLVEGELARRHPVLASYMKRSIESKGRGRRSRG